MRNKKLKVGLIGCGGIAHQKHLPALAKLNSLCEIVGFCDIVEKRAVIAREKFGTYRNRIYTNYKNLLNDNTIDVIFVLTPNVDHSPITVDAFDAGKHVLCEKPMAHNTIAAKKMLNAAKKAKKKFTIGYQNRYREDVQTLKKACITGELGEIYFAKAHAIRRRAVPNWGVFQNKSKQGGGPLIDIGTHALDIVLWLTNNYEPESVSGSVYYKMGDRSEANIFGSWDPPMLEVEDSAFGFIKMKDGSTIFLEASWILNILDIKEASCTLCGTEGGATVIANETTSSGDVTFNYVKHDKLLESKPSSTMGIDYFSGHLPSAAELEAKNWLLSIINDEEVYVKPEEAFTVTKILDSIYKSAETGMAIKF